MPRISGPLRLDDLEDGSYRMKVSREFGYRCSELGIDIWVPAGYISDGATIPQFFWRVIGGKWGPYRSAAVPHDYLYSDGNVAYPKVTKKQADLLFLYRMRELGIGIVRRTLMYWAVRLNFRGGHWNK